MELEYRGTHRHFAPVRVDELLTPEISTRSCPRTAVLGRADPATARAA
jgi:hypothetical protein